MKTISLSATFDGEHIKLEEAFPLSKNARLLVTVLPENENEDPAFREYWKQLALAGLNRACAPDEPEYRLEMVREPNAEYGGR